MFDYDWDWSVLWVYRYALLDGMWVTVQLSILANIAGTLAGLALGTLLSLDGEKRSPHSRLLLFFVDAIKALPPLILLLLLYYWLPYALNIKSSFWIALIALTLGLAVFVADVFRHAVNGVPRPLIEASYALGMTKRMVIMHIVMPEALRSIVPTLGLLYLDIIKLSSLSSVIAVAELVHRASEISTFTFRFLEVYAGLAVIYLVILLPFSYFVRRLENSPRFLRRS